jgi:hypothetical protein
LDADVFIPERYLLGYGFLDHVAPYAHTAMAGLALADLELLLNDRNYLFP